MDCYLPVFIFDCHICWSKCAGVNIVSRDNDRQQNYGGFLSSAILRKHSLKFSTVLRHYRCFITYLTRFCVLCFLCFSIFSTRLCWRETGDCQEETEAEKKGQKEQTVQGEGLQETEKVHVASAASLQAQVLHSRATHAGRPGANRGYNRFCRFLLRAFRRRPRPQGTPLMTSAPPPSPPPPIKRVSPRYIRYVCVTVHCALNELSLRNLTPITSLHLSISEHHLAFLRTKHEYIIQYTQLKRWKNFDIEL